MAEHGKEEERSRIVSCTASKGADAFFLTHPQIGSRMNYKPFLLAFIAVFCSANYAFAQQQSQQEWTERYDARFLKQDPQVGATMPEVSAFDSEGKPFQLSSTRGKYTVIVFGCLT